MFELWKLKWSRAKVIRCYQPHLDKARKAREFGEWHRLLDEERLSLEPIDNRIQALISERIMAEAEKFDVEIPSYSRESELWTHNGYTGAVYLTSKGRSHLRKLIDDEKARRFEVKARWIKLLIRLIIALAGLIGVITGLISVSRR